MKYLLDVNVLLAIGYRRHEFHSDVTAWAKRKTLLTCSISELGFVRILSGLPETDVPVSLCRRLLATMKREWKMMQVADEESASDLPEWVRHPKQTTDGHLTNIAKAAGARLATLDRRIPGAVYIPIPKAHEKS